MSEKKTVSKRGSKVLPTPAKAAPAKAAATPAKATATKARRSPAGVDVEALRAQLAKAQRAEAALRGTQARLKAQADIATEELQATNEALRLQSAELSQTVQTLSAQEAQLSKLTRIYAVLSRVNEAIVRTHARPALFQAVCQIVATGGFPLVWIGEVQDQQVVPAAWCGPAADYLTKIRVELQGPLSLGPTGTCIREHHAVINDDFDANPATRPWQAAARQFGFHASAAFPLHCQGQAVAALTLYAAEPKTFDPDQVGLLEALAADISYALEAMRQEQSRQQMEQALHASEEKYRRLIENVNDLVCEVDAQARYQFVNAQYEQTLGYAPAELLGHYVRELIHPDDLQHSTPTFQKLVDGRTVTRNEWRFRHKHGQWRWFDCLAQTYEKAPGEVRVVVIARDVTDRRQMEEGLRQSEARFRTIAEAVPVLVCITRLEDAVILFTNAVNNKAFGLRGEDIVGTRGPDYYWDPADRAKMIAQFKAQGYVDNYPLKVKRSDGTPFWIMTTVRPVTYQGQAAIIGASLDITEYKRQEDQLRYQADILQSVNDAVIVTDLDFRVTAWNPPAERMYGWTADEVLGRPVKEAVRSQMPEAQRAAIYDADQAGHAAALELVQLARDGRPMTAECSAMPLRNAAGAIIGYVTINRDITARKQAEAALRESETRFRSVLDQSVDVIYRLNVQTGRFEYISPASTAILGYTPAELMEQDSATTLAMVHSDDVAALRAALAHLAQTGFATAEYRQCVKSGGYRWLSNHMALTRDAAGQPLYQGGNIRDISLLKLVEAERARLLAEVEQRAAELEATLAAMATGLIVYNQAGNAIRMNQAAERVFRPELFSTTTVAERVRVVQWQKESGEPFRPEEVPVARALRGETARDVVIAAPFPDRTVWIAASAAPIRTPDGAIRGAVASFIDITSRKEAEKVIRDQNEQLQVQYEELTVQRETLEMQNEALAAAQREAENQRQRLAAMMEALPVGVAITDAQGGRVQANAAYEQIWGGPRPDPQPVADYAAYQAWWADTGEPVTPHAWASAQAVEQDRVVAGQVLEIRRFDGRRAVVVNSAAPVRNAQGQIIGSAVALQDITALKAAEERLAYQARLLARVHDAIIGLDEQFQITFWNPVAQELYGWTAAEVLGRTTVEVFQPQPVGPSWAEATQSLRQTGYYEGEAYHHRKDGTVILVHTRSADVRDPQGDFRGAVMSIRDITERRRLENEMRRARDELEVRVCERTAELEEEIEERKQAEALVRENARRAQALAEIAQALAEAKFDEHAASAAVTQCTAELFDDACLVTLLSADRQQLCTEALHHPDPAIAARLRHFLPALPARFEAGHIARHLIETDQPLRVPDFTAAAGQDWIVPGYRAAAAKAGLQGLLAVPLHAQGQVIGQLLLLRLRPGAPYTEADELTAQNLADRLALALANARLYQDLENALAQEQAMHQKLAQAEKLSALGRMVSSVAHELNNPLQTIRNCLYLTKNDLPADSPIHEYLEMANSETGRLVKLVAQLRQLYRPPMAPTETHDLAHLLQDVQTLLLPQLLGGQVQWQQPPGRSRYPVAIIPDRVKQVLINIVTNAVEAMQPAGGQLTVDLVPSADGSQVGARFKDTGPGIAAENLGRLFEPFFTTKSQGLGLGLAICYEIAQQHGGQITAESQPGQGAVFTFWLPLARPAEDEGAGAGG